MKYGLQMYSVRDAAEKDLLGTLEKVAALGYHYAEFAGFFGYSAEAVRDKLLECGMEVSSTHTGMQELADDVIGETIRYHKTLGNRLIVLPWADLDNQQKLDDFVAQTEKVQARLADEGIRLGYHNHAHEFKPNADGSCIWEQLEERTRLDLEIDTYWAFVGGRDPLEMMERLKERVRIIHIKDGLVDGSGRPLGMGEAPAAAVYRKAVELGDRLIVESETCQPSGLEEARVCMAFLKAQE